MQVLKTEIVPASSPSSSEISDLKIGVDTPNIGGEGSFAVIMTTVDGKRYIMGLATEIKS